MDTLVAPDQASAEAFSERILLDTSAAMTALLAALGDRLGLFQDLFAQGPATSAELARRTGIEERYAREWLAAMAAAGYLRHEPARNRFELPPEHAPALARENGPRFLCGLLQMVPALAAAFDNLAEAFRCGGGVLPSAYGEDLSEGMDRFSAVWFENALVQNWIPAMPEVQRKLVAGADVADVGCGRGRALIKLARCFPMSRYDGFDSQGQAIAVARKNARVLGVADRVRFEWRNASQGLPSRYDIITTFDAIHETVCPAELLRKIRETLGPDGIYVCLETRCSEKLQENTGPLGAALYGLSVLHCLPASLAGGGDGLGAMGVAEPVIRRLCQEAGFSSVRPVPVEDAFHSLYEIRF